MRWSVVIPVWNGHEHLPACLEAVLAQEPAPLEIITVDNASTDGSAALIAERFPQVRLLRQDRNLGFAGGCNAGLRISQGEGIVLLNQDTQVLPGWLAALHDALTRPAVGIAGCKSLFSGTSLIQHAGGYIEWPLAAAHHFGERQPDGPKWDIPKPVEYVTGAAMAIARPVLERVGLLDEGFWPGYFEDADYCFRAREAGFEVWYWPAAELRHAESSSTPAPLQRSRYYQRGRLRFVLKHMPPERWLNEFLPAEITYQPAAIRGFESQALRLGYLEAILAAPRILDQRWHASPSVVQAVVEALQELSWRAWVTDLQTLTEQAQSGLAGSTPIAVSNTARPELSLPPSVPFREYTFRSQLTVIGRPLAWLRGLWYSVAARWGVRDLAEQQAAINAQVQIQLLALRLRMVQLAEGNAIIANSLAEFDPAASAQELPTNGRRDSGRLD